MFTDDELIRKRVEARKHARDIFNLIEHEAKDYNSSIKQHFYSCLRELLTPVSPPIKSSEVMSDEEAKLFEKKKFPYGGYKGKQVGAILESDPVYIDCLIKRTENDKFMKDLIKYSQVSWVSKKIDDAINNGK